MERGICLAALLVAVFVKLFTVDDPGTKALAEGETAKAKSTKTLFMLQHTIVEDYICESGLTPQLKGEISDITADHVLKYRA
jgi:hypothetical protein